MNNLRRKLAVILSIIVFFTAFPLHNLMSQSQFQGVLAASVTPSPSQWLTTAAKSVDMPIGTNFWFLATWSGETPFKNSPDWANAYSNSTDIWNSTFISELAPYTVLRFMDWGSTNNNPIKTWSQRTLPTSTKNFAPDTSTPSGLAYEWMIDLCNRTNKDFWLCMPHQVDDNYMTNLAQLVKLKLNPNLKCFLEYSNEVWNPGFQQYQYAIDKAIAKSFEPTCGYASYYVYRSFQMFKLFKDVFGTEMSARVKRVCSYSGDIGLFDVGYGTIIADKTTNPSNQRADYFACAPYVGAGIDGNSVNRVALFHADVDAKLKNYVIPAWQTALRYKMPLITYEGGQHLLTGAQVLSADPLLYNEYIYMLNKFSQYLKMFVHYNHCGKWASGGAWGAKAYTGQDINQTPKYRALVDWNAATPNPAFAPTPTPTPSPKPTAKPTPTPAPNYEAPIITISKYSKAFTNKNITVSAKTNKGVLNSKSHTFTKNGKFTFRAEDKYGNESSEQVVITNIDKTKPMIAVKNSADKKINNGATVKGTFLIVVSDKNFSSKRLLLNSHKISWPKGSKVKAKGVYCVTAADKAGNVTNFKFRIS